MGWCNVRGDCDLHDADCSYHRRAQSEEGSLPWISATLQATKIRGEVVWYGGEGCCKALELAYIALPRKVLQGSVRYHPAVEVPGKDASSKVPSESEEVQCEVLVVPSVRVDTWVHTFPVVTSDETSGCCAAYCRAGQWPSRVSVATNIKPNSGLPTSNPTDGSVAGTIKTDDIGTLAYGKKKEKISHGHFDWERVTSRWVLQTAQNLTDNRRNEVKDPGKVCKSFKLRNCQKNVRDCTDVKIKLENALDLIEQVN